MVCEVIEIEKSIFLGGEGAGLGLYKIEFYCELLISTLCGIFTETPQIIISSVQSSYNEGSVVSTICTASGTPDPDVQWIRSEIKITEGKKESSLTFNSINRTDDGQYTCRATNLAGHDEKHVTLVVNCK